MDFKLPKIAHEGNIFIIIFAVITVVLFLFSSILGIIGVILTVWCVAFFRDPERVTPQLDSLIVAPADGKIIKVEKVIPPAELGISEEMLKISIFMNVFNVHVNRTPCSGVIDKILYYPGKFLNASFDKASVDNERQSFIMTTSNGHQVAFVQIAGLVARRIVKFIEEDTAVKVGEKVGLIRFGSRVDVYLPADITPFVSVGQTTIAGETILADFEYKGEPMVYQIHDRAKSR
ncbi:MAG: phosphatidylserine decarboxylase [Alphaproteobacteria bacterium]|jgi:phosphatidylserine decarboxylase|nr:phosphatidylserine decarboxylase [Alphaproteobacteria bacterium]